MATSVSHANGASTWQGRTAAAYGSAAVVGLLAAARFLLEASRDSVWLLDWRVDFPCAMKAAFGIPCPACGMTRSVILTVHGHLADGLVMNPGGPMLVFGLVALAVTLALLAQRSTRPSEVILSSVRTAALVYGLAVTGVLVVNWIAQLALG